jgi:hypothetical protein
MVAFVVALALALAWVRARARAMARVLARALVRAVARVGGGEGSGMVGGGGRGGGGGGGGAYVRHQQRGVGGGGALAVERVQSPMMTCLACIALLASLCSACVALLASLVSHVNPSPPSLRQLWQRSNVLVSKPNQTESKLWMLRLGSPSKDQLDMLPGNAIRIPLVFEYDLFHFLDFKEHACIWKQAAQHSAERTTEAKKHFTWILASCAHLVWITLIQTNNGPCQSIVGWVFFISPDHQ